MLFAALTACLFACSAICNTRIASLMDKATANLLRLLIASAALGLLTLWLDPGSLHPRPFAWLFLSGAVGFGLGDIAMFLAFTRIGSRLTVLINFCIATVLGTIADWYWLGDKLGGAEAGSIAVILSGLAIALLAAKRKGARHGSFAFGIAAAVVAGIGQGLGASISRHAEEVAATEGFAVSGISQAFQRVLAGFACLIIVYAIRRARGTLTAPLSTAKNRTSWLFAAAMFGPVLGVSCFQHSLGIVGNSGVVMAVVATSPLVLIPLAYVFEGDRPTRLSIVGGVIGVGGVVAMALLRHA